MLHRLGLSLLVLGGCHFGSRAATFAPARGGAGVEVAVSLRRGEPVEGELLTVGDTALLVLSARRLVLVRAAAVREARLAQRSDVVIGVREGRFGPRDAVGEARLVSRFPQGLTPELLRRLLDAHGQKALDVVSP